MLFSLNDQSFCYTAQKSQIVISASKFNENLHFSFGTFFNQLCLRLMILFKSTIRYRANLRFSRGGGGFSKIF